jgi:hypothetical protein
VEYDLFGPPDFNAITYCPDWSDGTDMDECYYTKVLNIGDEIVPRGYNKEYRIEEIIKEGDDG